MSSRLQTDILVCGGGVAGTMAAVAAAREGASVALVERYGFLGGNATAGAVAQFNCWQTGNGRTVVAGLAREVVERLRSYGGAGAHQVFTMSTGHAMDRVEYAPEVLKLVLDDMVLEAGVMPLFHTQLLDISTVAARGIERSVHEVQLLGKGGILPVSLTVLVDASGDMDAVRLAGGAFLSLCEQETLQPATMMFRFGPIDFREFDAIPKAQLKQLAEQGVVQGYLARTALHAARNPFSNDAWFNISRLALDATDPVALSQAEMQGRQQAWRAAQYLQAQVPGCRQGALVSFATQVGIRETRRVHGKHVLTASELLQPLAFPDAIACGAYPIDIHPAQGSGLSYQAMGPDHAYQIPYRCLQPNGLANVLLAGRGVSADHEALAAIRVMTISMAVGQAAGVAAAMAVRLPTEETGEVGRVPVDRLQETLLNNKAVLA